MCSDWDFGCLHFVYHHLELDVRVYYLAYFVWVCYFCLYLFLYLYLVLVSFQNSWCYSILSFIVSAFALHVFNSNLGSHFCWYQETFLIPILVRKVSILVRKKKSRFFDHCSAIQRRKCQKKRFVSFHRSDRHNRRLYDRRTLKAKRQVFRIRHVCSSDLKSNEQLGLGN